MLAEGLPTEAISPFGTLRASLGRETLRLAQGKLFDDQKAFAA